MKGIAEDKNIIYIAAESLQSFVINKELNGEKSLHSERLSLKTAIILITFIIKHY